MSKPKYRDEYLRKIKDNLKSFNINEDGIKLKVQNFCSKFSFNEGEIFKKLKEDKMFRAFFIKDPAKQNIYENTFAVFLESIDNVFNFKKLPNSGNNSVFIISQEVRIKGISNKSITSQAKSMDFYFQYKGINSEFYVFHKYTKESGGAQDNQRNDVINAIEKASSAHTNDKIYVLFICDGDYYNSKIWNDIDAHIRNKNFKLLKSDELEPFLLSLIK